MNTIIEIQHSMVGMTYGRTSNRHRYTFLKRRKELINGQWSEWHYFKREMRKPWGIISKQEYEGILRVNGNGELTKILEEAIIKKL